MKKLIAICLAMGMMATAAFAQEKSSEPVTQAQVAKVLVKALGLVSALPAAASDQQIFTVLMQNGICPPDGWAGDQVLTKKDLMVLLVQAIGAEDQVDNPEDPASWQAVLVANGIDMASLASEDTVMGLESLPVVVSQDYGATSIDPLVSEDAPARKGESYNTSVEMAPDSVTVSMPEVVTAITQAKHVKPQPKPTPH